MEEGAKGERSEKAFEEKLSLESDNIFSTSFGSKYGCLFGNRWLSVTI